MPCSFLSREFCVQSRFDTTARTRYFMADDIGSANFIHYASVKSKRVTKSVLAAELFAAVNALDTASTARASMNDILNGIISLILYTDSKSLVDSIIGINFTTEK